MHGPIEFQYGVFDPPRFKLEDDQGREPRFLIAFENVTYHQTVYG